MKRYVRLGKTPVDTPTECCMKLVAMRLWVERAINGTNVSKAELQQIRD
jgi:hypothetical protein